MAEAIARTLAPEGINVFSAGSEPSHIHPLAKQALDEVNISYRGQFSKGFGDVALSKMDHIITLCREEQCPLVPDGSRTHHWPLPDPAAVNQHHELDGFRSVRNTLSEMIRAFLRNGL